MKELTKEDLRKYTSTLHNHEIMDSDVAKANRLQALILNSRDAKRPVAGDIMICKGPAKEYKEGHIQSDNLEDYSCICTQPYAPFVSENEHEEVNFSASGGYWFSIPKEMQKTVKYVGKQKKIFKVWRKCDPAEGAAYFEVEVNVWEYFSEDIY